MEGICSLLPQTCSQGGRLHILLPQPLFISQRRLCMVSLLCWSIFTKYLSLSVSRQSSAASDSHHILFSLGLMLSKQKASNIGAGTWVHRSPASTFMVHSQKATPLATVRTMDLQSQRKAFFANFLKSWRFFPTEKSVPADAHVACWAPHISLSASHVKYC